MTPSTGTLAPPDHVDVASRAERSGEGGGAPARAKGGAPARAKGIELLGPLAGSGYKSAPSLVRRADGQTIQVTPLLYEVLDALDGRRTYDEVAAVVSERVSREATADDVRFLVDKKLRPLGVVSKADGSEPAVKKANPLLGLRLRKVITDRSVTQRITKPFAALFRPFIVVPVILMFLLTTAWVLFEEGLASATHQALYEPGVLLLLFGLTMLSAAFHEVGHASAATYGGAAPGAMGFAFYLIWPAFYTDVTDSYRLGRGGRLRVDLGGFYFNAIFALIMLGLAAATGSEALLLLVPAQLLHMLHQLVPFVRFDGYHILADITGVPDLYSHIKPTLLHLLPTRWGKREPNLLKPWVRAVVTLWVLLVVPVLAFALVMMVKVLPRVAATAWDSVAGRWALLQANTTHGDVVEAAVDLISILTIALPVFGMVYLLMRIVRRMLRKVWRATEGHRIQRFFVVVAGLLAVTLLAWSWWPHGQYRPIQAEENGTIVPPLPPLGEEVMTLEQPAAALSSYAAPPLSGAQPQLVMITSPEGTPVTEAGPKTIVPVSPEDGGPKAPDGPLGPNDEWVFPFNPPAAPREGDNQALAVNTEDDSAVYDVAFAVLWVTDGSDVDQINEAWALASCKRCATVAIAFQGIFVVGGSDVIVPQNRAVAVNYECRRCQTVAIAMQLVTTLTKEPSPEAMERLAEVWDKLKRLKKRVAKIPLDDVYDRLGRIEDEIVDILVEDGALPPQPEDGSETPDEGDDVPQPDSTATPNDGTIGDSPTPTDEPTTESETSPEPAPSPTEEPSPTPTEEPSPTTSSTPEEPASSPSP